MCSIYRCGVDPLLLYTTSIYGCATAFTDLLEFPHLIRVSHPLHILTCHVLM